MSQTSVKKISVFTALMMMIGSIVGVGIFFKSHGILRSNDWNGIGTLISWIIGGLLSLAAALSFAEIGTMKTKRTTGLAAWSEKTAGKKFGYFVRFNYPFYYYGLLASALGFFASEAFFNVMACYGAFKISEIPVWTHAIVGFVIASGFIVLNYMSVHYSGKFQQVATILKWIPLVAVAALGIIMATTNEMNPSYRRPIYLANPDHKPEDFNSLYGRNSFTNGQSFKFTGMLAAIPAVLFAFDSFLTAPTLVNKVKGGSKKIPFIVIVGIVSCLVLYLLIGVSASLHGSGMVSSTPLTGGDVDGSGIFDQLFSHGTATTIGEIVMVFLFISTWGVLNGITASAVTTIDQAVETETIALSSFIKKKTKRSGLYYSLATYGFWFIIYLIGTAVTNGDAFVDGLSNFSSLFAFGIYGYVILRYTLKRDMYDSKKINNNLYKVFAWIAIVGTILIVGYQIIYGFFIGAIIHPNDSTHWGLFYETGGINAEGSIYIMFSMLTLFITAPILNYYWLARKEKKKVFIDTFK